jgi:hypothetical protein
MRRRLVWLGSSLLLVLGLVVAAILLPKDHGVHYQLNPTGTQLPQGYRAPPKEVHVTAVERRAVNETLLAFIRTGVTRADSAAAWPLTTPEMRSGISRRDWNRGELPVQPFPASIPSVPEWNIITSYPGDLTVDLLLQPRPGAKVGPIAFAVELKRRQGRWLLDSMVTEQAFGASAPSAKPLPPGFKGHEPKARLSPFYIIVPGALLGLALIVPMLIALSQFSRTRRIERRYRRERRP